MLVWGRLVNSKIEEPKITFKERLSKFVKNQLNFSAFWYYQTLVFMGAFLALIIFAIWPPFDLTAFITDGLIFLLLCELSYYRYYNWKIEKSKGFKIGAQMVVNVVHDEGILKYNRDGQAYALYSNKVATKDKK